MQNLHTKVKQGRTRMQIIKMWKLNLQNEKARKQKLKTTNYKAGNYYKQFYKN